MKILLSEIDSLGYDEGLLRFLNQNSGLHDYIIDPRRADWLCHCLSKSNLRCLDIGSGFGNISEKLSFNFQTVYSLESVKERIEFQKRRFKNSNITNITIPAFPIFFCFRSGPIFLENRKPPCAVSRWCSVR